MDELQAATKFKTDLAYGLTLKSLEKNAKTVGKAWCGSWYGYQAYVYYRNLDAPSPGTQFSHRWGFETDPFSESREESSWTEYSEDEIMSLLEEGIEASDIRNAMRFAGQCIYQFNNKKEDVLDIIRIVQENNSPLLDNLLDRIEKLKVPTVDEIVANDRPSEMSTEDPIALQQGFRTPPHIQVRAKVHWILGVANAIHEPPAGKKIIDHILQLIRSSQIAFLVLTGEDLLEDKTIHPRLNVVHEVGLCQALLGVDNTIIMLEEGCAEFTNISGLVHIRFPKNDLMAKSEEIRRVLETRNIRSSGNVI